MNRIVNLHSPILLSTEEVVCELSASNASALALELAVVRYFPEDVIVMRSKGIEVSLASLQVDRVSKAECYWLHGDRAILMKLGTNQLDYLSRQCLTVYRSHVADISHIHIEGKLGSADLDLTVLFEHSKPPVQFDSGSEWMKKNT
jgi:hypothetical protein